MYVDVKIKILSEYGNEKLIKNKFIKNKNLIKIYSASTKMKILCGA